MLFLFAYAGSAATVGLYFLEGTRYLLGGGLFLLANVCFGASVVFYNAWLPEIASSGEPRFRLLRGVGARVPRGRGPPSPEPDPLFPRARLRPDERRGGPDQPRLGGGVVGRLLPRAARHDASPGGRAAASGGGGAPRHGIPPAAAHVRGGEGPPAAPAVPRRLPPLQRRDTDGDRPLVPVRPGGAGPLRFDADHGDPHGPVRRLFRGPALQRVREAGGGEGGGGGQSRPVDGDARLRLRRASGCDRVLRDGGMRGRRPRREPGPLPLPLLADDPARAGGGVLLPVRGERAGDELAGAPLFRAGAAVHGKLPRRDPLAGGLLHRGARPAAARGRRARAEAEATPGPGTTP